MLAYIGPYGPTGAYGLCTMPCSSACVGPGAPAMEDAAGAIVGWYS